MNYSSGPPAAAVAVFIGFIVLFVLAMSTVSTIAWCFIFKRAGYSWALGLLTLVPIANIVVFFVLAFSRWPIQNEVDRLRAAAGPAASSRYGGVYYPVQPPQGQAQERT